MVAMEVDRLDLVGDLMLVHDPFGGIELGDDCHERLPTAPRLGIIREPA
jgi:hypothetical protein